MSKGLPYYPPHPNPSTTIHHVGLGEVPGQPRFKPHRYYVGAHHRHRGRRHLEAREPALRRIHYRLLCVLVLRAAHDRLTEKTGEPTTRP